MVHSCTEYIKLFILRRVLEFYMYVGFQFAIKMYDSYICTSELSVTYEVVLTLVQMLHL